MDKVRRLKRVVGLANHTILVTKNGQDIAIDDSGAPIFGPDGALTGIVLVFRDVTEQRAAQRASARSPPSLSSRAMRLLLRTSTVLFRPGTPALNGSLAIRLVRLSASLSRF